MLWDQGEDAAAAEDISGGGLPLQAILDKARPEQYAPPVWVQPPRGENGVWTVRSMGPSRPDRVTAHYDRWTGEELMRITFADQNPVDQFMAQGVAFHEGQLYGPLNQLTGLLAALGVVALSLTGALMWWRRRPKGRLGLPPMPSDKRLASSLVVLVICLGIFLPMAGVTLIIALVADLIFGRIVRRGRKQPA
jgi:uncharacterized iron-regulated membrane protein